MRLEIHLTDTERDRLLRPVNGKGGFQDVVRLLQQHLAGDTVFLTRVDGIERVSR
jgi:hypothetical protein